MTQIISTCHIMRENYGSMLIFAGNKFICPMSTVHAFLILFLVAAGIALAGWLFWRGWSPEQLPQWATLIWALMVLLSFGRNLLPASIRWNDTVSIVQGVVGLIVVLLSIKCLVLLIRHGSSLSDAQRWAAWLGLAPLIIGALMVLLLLWMAGAFAQKKG